MFAGARNEKINIYNILLKSTLYESSVQKIGSRLTARLLYYQLLRLARMLRRSVIKPYISTHILGNDGRHKQPRVITSLSSILRRRRKFFTLDNYFEPKVLEKPRYAQENVQSTVHESCCTYSTQLIST